MISDYEAFLLYFPRALASKKSEVVDVVMNDNNNDEDDMTAPAAADTELSSDWDWDWEWDWESRIENRNSPSAPWAR